MANNDVPSKKDQRIYRILREHCDAPRILFAPDDTLLLHRDGSMKEVMLLSTKLFTYMIKCKGCKLYARWANRQLTVVANNDSVSLTSLDTRAMTSDPLPYKETVDAAVNEFRSVSLETRSAVEAGYIEERITYLIQTAQQTAALLEDEERGGGITPRTGGGSGAVDAEESDSASVSSDSENGDGIAVASPIALVNTTGRAGPQHGDSGKRRGTEALLQMAPSRYISITSLVDGEFADYTTLKNAYIRHDEENLLRDLGIFIKENEGQVETLCEYHYPAFIHAAQQCIGISERDAELVGEELSGAAALVRMAVMNMRKVASSLVTSRSTRDNLQQVRTLLSKAIAVAEYLETAEAQTQKQQLVGAVISLRELVRLAAPLSEYALGEYVLHLRVPALTQNVFTYAVQHLNTWLGVLRDKAYPVGAASLRWDGTVAAGYMASKVIPGAMDDEWQLSESFEPAVLRLTAFSECDAVTAVSNGAGIQAVFLELHREEYLTKYYAEGRVQQAKADILEATLPLTGLSQQEVLERFRVYCATALGFILIEDIVYCATAPHIHSRAEIIQLWTSISGKVAEWAVKVLKVLLSDPSSTKEAVAFVAVIQSLIRCAADNVKSVELNTVALTRVMETASDQLISSWLQDACVGCMQVIMMDTFVPLTVSDAAHFESYVTRFNLHHCASLELDIPTTYTSGSLVLPYSCLVPLIGDQVLDFLQRCCTTTVTSASSVVMQSELNNVDEMLLKYLSVLFRSVAESLQGQLMSISANSILQLAVYVTTCSVMPVIVSCVEQQYVLHWQRDYAAGTAQRMGHPTIMEDCSRYFARSIQRGIERLLDAYRGEVEERLKPIRRLAFWRMQLEGRRQSKSGVGETLNVAMDYALGIIPKISPVLQTAVLRSVVGTTFTNVAMMMLSSMETAVTTAYQDGERDFVLLRDCIGEFEQEYGAGASAWQRRLAELLPGLRAAQCFPQTATSNMDDVRQWLSIKEQQYMMEKANQPQILAGIEGAGKAMSKGLQAVGKTVTATANVFKRDQ